MSIQMPPLKKVAQFSGKLTTLHYAYGYLLKSLVVPIESIPFSTLVNVSACLCLHTIQSPTNNTLKLPIGQLPPAPRHNTSLEETVHHFPFVNYFIVIPLSYNSGVVL